MVLEFFRKNYLSTGHAKISSEQPTCSILVKFRIVMYYKTHMTFPVLFIFLLVRERENILTFQ